MSIWPSLFDHAMWADAQILSAIATLPAGSTARADAERIYAHLAAASHVWLSRLDRRAPEHAVWPTLSLEQAGALSAESLAGLREWASRGEAVLGSPLEYVTSTGQPFRNTVGEVIAQAVLHHSHHRGQLALLIRQGGGTPSPTDFIVYTRPAARRQG